MGIGSRVLLARVLGWLADPREGLEHSYRRQVERLAKMQPAEQEGLNVARARLGITVELSRVRLEARETTREAAAAGGRLDDAWSRLSAASGGAGSGGAGSGGAGARRRLVSQLRSDITVLAGCRGRLDRQTGTLRRLQGELDGQASRALESGREDLACEATARQSAIGRQLAELAAWRDSWQAEVDRFTAAYERLTADPGGVAGE